MPEHLLWQQTAGQAISCQSASFFTFEGHAAFPFIRSTQKWFLEIRSALFENCVILKGLNSEDHALFAIKTWKHRTNSSKHLCIVPQTTMMLTVVSCVLFLMTVVESAPAVPVQHQDKDRRILSISRSGSERIDQDIAYTAKPYQFGFELEDGFGMSQYRSEASDGTGVVKGSYGYMDPMGIYRKVEYTADENGYRAVIRSNEPGTANQNVADALFIVEPPPPGVMQQDVGNDISPRDSKA